eukprot:GFUD01019118.1.p1 GENE.GFUD01019118.1~~GFUD01019118.1.p1  ORF type:complete len:725 (+),score=167.19 GFUD01019118.1:75-2177(+)
MPPLKVWQPKSLEDQCIQRYIFYLKDETDIIFHMRAYETRSVLLRNVSPGSMFRILDRQLCLGLTGILQDIVRQKMTAILIQDLHNLASEAIKTMTSSRSYQIISERQIAERAATRIGSGRSSPCYEESFSSPSLYVTCSPFPWNSPHPHISRPNTLTSNYRSLPVFQLLELVLNVNVRILDFSKNREWLESEEMNEISRILWKIVGERCQQLEKFIIPKELTYSSTLNSVILNGSCLVQLTLKRNIPNNMFLNEIGKNCPNLQELDIAGAEVVTDFGIVCLLYADPEQIFLKCWNRERTVGQQKRSMRAFPHPHFDKQIPDQQEPQPRGTKNANGGNYLYLRRSFHEGLRSDTGDTGDWERLPIGNSLQKLRLENTKVKGDGASVVLETCPNIFSLGYLVFAAAGLKQVFGYEDRADTKFTEIFYRGPSDQKLSTIANCCPNLETMFLGSNNPRSLNSGVFRHWPRLAYLTLENIMVENIVHCLEEVGGQLRGLKIQCSGFDLSDIAVLCPHLKSLIIQKEAPNPVINPVRSSKTRLFAQLEHVEVSCPQFSKNCFGFILKNAVKLVSIKVLHVPKLSRVDFESWLCTNPLQRLESLIIFKAPELSLDTIMWLLEEMESITELGDLHAMDFAKNANDVRKLHQEIKKKEWDISLVDSSQGIDTEERDFGKLQSLHWFYLTPSEGYKQSGGSGSGRARQM